MTVEKDRTYKCIDWIIDIKIKAEHIEYFMRNTLLIVLMCNSELNINLEEELQKIETKDCKHNTDIKNLW